MSASQLRPYDRPTRPTPFVVRLLGRPGPRGLFRPAAKLTLLAGWFGGLFLAAAAHADALVVLGLAAGVGAAVVLVVLLAVEARIGEWRRFDADFRDYAAAQAGQRPTSGKWLKRTA